MRVHAVRDGRHLLLSGGKTPGSSAFFGTAEEQGLIWHAIMECVYYLEPHMTHFAGTICSGELEEKRLAAIRSREAVERELKNIDDRLTHHAYLVGQRVSAADVVVYPVVELLVNTAEKENTEAVSGKFRNIERHFPAVHAWCRKIEKIPGFDRGKC